MNTNPTAADLRARAAESARTAAESFERCDTDGFMSQWANGLSAERDRLQADIVEAGGVSTFAALFDLAGNLVPAKLINTRYGTAWALLDEATDSFTGTFITAFPKRRATIEAKGYREGKVTAPARADLRGANMTSVRAVVIRTDGGWSRDVTVVDNGMGG